MCTGGRYCCWLGKAGVVGGGGGMSLGKRCCCCLLVIGCGGLLSVPCRLSVVVRRRLTAPGRPARSASSPPPPGVCRAGAAAHQTAGAGGSDKKALYEVAIEDSPFSFQVLRRGEGRAVFNTTSTRLVFKVGLLRGGGH